jgi:hypothetical protein
MRQGNTENRMLYHSQRLRETRQNMSYYHHQRAIGIQPYEENPNGKRISSHSLRTDSGESRKSGSDRHQEKAQDRGGVDRNDSSEVYELCNHQLRLEETHQEPTQTGLLPKPIRTRRDQT